MQNKPLNNNKNRMVHSFGAENQTEMFQKCSYTATAKEVAEFMATWNGVLNIPKIVSLNGRQNLMIKFLSDDFNRDNYREAIRKMASSRFLTGKNKWKWKATLDWFIEGANMIKILEGKYDNKDELDKRPVAEQPDTI